MAALAVAHVDGAARPYRRRVHSVGAIMRAVLSGRAAVEDHRLEAAPPVATWMPEASLPSPSGSESTDRDWPTPASFARCSLLTAKSHPALVGKGCGPPLPSLCRRYRTPPRASSGRACSTPCHTPARGGPDYTLFLAKGRGSARHPHHGRRKGRRQWKPEFKSVFL